MIRVSAGIEDAADLVADFGQALSRLEPGRARQPEAACQ
jgi:hypothetical protein